MKRTLSCTVREHAKYFEENEISFALMGCMEEDDVNAIPCKCPFRVRLIFI